MADRDPVDVVIGYHQRTKHHTHRYAQALGYLDWDTQPNPFRRFEGAPRIRLDEVPVKPEPTYAALFQEPPLPPRGLDRSSLSQLFYDSLALSAWKEFGENRWSLRVNPSSGNLHPTEGYLLTGAIPGVLESPGLYHYAPHDHELEHRRTFTPGAWESMRLPPGAVLFGLTSIHWRESWKYGERAFRYCQHDVGHAIAAVVLAARGLGWSARVLDGVADALLTDLLGVATQSGPEAEHPDVLLLITPGDAAVLPSALAPLSQGPMVGKENTLSSDHHEWSIIEVVAEAAERLGSEPAASAAPRAERTRVPCPLVPARQIVRQRRSAVSMDGTTSIAREQFLGMVARTSPGDGDTVFGALPWRPAIHLAVFVHRVQGLSPGLYFVVRDPDSLRGLRAAMRPEFAWTHVVHNLYLLREANVRDAARSISCGQEIASDGAFAVGMIAQFEPELRRHGAWFYRALHWEAGAIGQVLYLEAEAAGVRATGIGCFFDDAMHDLLGLRDASFQTVYHFTVGGPVEDTRLRSAPAYAHRSL
jgi:SagB-type dehydrogenase family enzyme